MMNVHAACRITCLASPRSQVVAGRLGMNSADLECLDHISRGPVTAGRLAELTRLTTGAITGVIDRLERAGLARRERDANDRRKIRVKALPAVSERVAPMERAAMVVLSKHRDDELALFLDFLITARDAALTAMSQLRALSEPRSTPKLPKGK
jgi:DNA-binding MarR family transcriptional regulator